MTRNECVSKLDAADEALTNMDEESEAFDSAIAAARAAINAAGAILLAGTRDGTEAGGS